MTHTAITVGGRMFPARLCQRCFQLTHVCAPTVAGLERAWAKHEEWHKEHAELWLSMSLHGKRTCASCKVKFAGTHKNCPKCNAERRRKLVKCITCKTRWRIPGYDRCRACYGMRKARLDNRNGGISLVASKNAKEAQL